MPGHELGIAGLDAHAPRPQLAPHQAAQRLVEPGRQPGGDRGAHPDAQARGVTRESAAEGVLIVGPSQPWLSHNLIQSNKGAGVAAREGAHPSLLGNVIDHNLLDVPGDKEEIRRQNFFPEAGRGSNPVRGHK